MTSTLLTAPPKYQPAVVVTVPVEATTLPLTVLRDELKAEPAPVPPAPVQAPVWRDDPAPAAASAPASEVQASEASSAAGAMGHPPGGADQAQHGGQPASQGGVDGGEQRGGGRPDFAEAGGKDVSKIDALHEQAPSVLARLLGH